MTSMALLSIRSSSHSKFTNRCSTDIDAPYRVSPYHSVDLDGDDKRPNGQHSAAPHCYIGTCVGIKPYFKMPAILGRAAASAGMRCWAVPSEQECFTSGTLRPAVTILVTIRAERNQSADPNWPTRRIRGIGHLRASVSIQACAKRRRRPLPR
jgi:hypothetical protein